MFGSRGGSSVEWLIAGLGNPGTKYENTRHNMGFRAVELLAEQKGVKLNKVKFKSAYNLMEFAGARCLVMKPQTYMNLSGEAVREAAQFYKIPPDHVLVIYDDVALPVGKLRVRPTGSAGGPKFSKFSADRPDFSIVSHIKNLALAVMTANNYNESWSKNDARRPRGGKWRIYAATGVRQKTDRRGH